MTNHPITPLISIVSPIYLAEGIVDDLVKQIIEAVNLISEHYEIILVDDGSQDGSWKKIEENSLKNPKVKGIRLSRNFGQHYAITGGLDASKGDWVVVIDCDLQDPPSAIINLLEKAREGFDIVYARKNSRSHGFLKNFFAKIFYRLLSWISNLQMDPNIGTFSILSRRAVNAFLKFNDYRRSYLIVLKWIGFKNAYIQVEHYKRKQGKSSYSFLKLIGLAINLAVSYSYKPLIISIYAGVVFSALSFLGAFIVLYKYLTKDLLPGWTSMIVLLSLIGGLLMIFLGIIGLYLSKVFEQSKNRPLFIIQETKNMN